MPKFLNQIVKSQLDVTTILEWMSLHDLIYYLVAFYKCFDLWLHHYCGSHLLKNNFYRDKRKQKENFENSVMYQNKTSICKHVAINIVFKAFIVIGDFPIIYTRCFTSLDLGLDITIFE